MVGPEPAIPGRVDRTVVALEIAMMQLMVKVRCIYRDLVLYKQFFKSRVRKGRSETPAVYVDKEDYRVRWDDEMNQH